MIGVPAFAEKFNVNPDTVRRWCREGKIVGAEHDGKGKPWRIPENAFPPKHMDIIHRKLNTAD